jgi:hypothetical protein
LLYAIHVWLERISCVTKATFYYYTCETYARDTFIIFFIYFMLFLIPNSTSINWESVFKTNSLPADGWQLYRRTFMSCEVASKKRGNVISKSQPLPLTEVNKYVCRFLIIAICFNILAYLIVIQSHGHQHCKLKFKVYCYHNADTLSSSCIEISHGQFDKRNFVPTFILFGFTIHTTVI